MNILKQVGRQAEIFDSGECSQNTNQINHQFNKSVYVHCLQGEHDSSLEAGRQALLPQCPSPALPHSPWNTNLRPVCLVSLTISFRASSALSLVSFTKETGFCRPCFSSSSATLQTEPAFQSPAQLSSFCCSSRTLKALSKYALQMQTVPKNLLQY